MIVYFVPCKRQKPNLIDDEKEIEKMKKKGFPKLSHPWAKSAAGFTLVELIVVIAILGVLGGVGTAGYAGYVKNAQKKADQTLVSNIIRAIEIGTNSMAFVPEDSIDVSATTYPVGFVTLNQDSCSVITSGSTYAKGSVDGACNMVTAYVYAFEPITLSTTCSVSNKSVTESGYKQVSCQQYTFCTEHTEGETAIAKDAKIPLNTSIAHSPGSGCKGGGFFGIGANCDNSKTLTQGVTSAYDGYYITNAKTFYKQSTSDPSVCEYAYAINSGNFAEVAAPTMNNQNHALYQALEAAFGNVSALKLQYDAWGKDEEDKVDFATMYTYAPKMLENVTGTAQLLVDIQGLKDYGFGSFFTQNEDYEGSADLLDSYATFLTENMTPGEWEAAWRAAGDSLDDEGTFGLDSKGAKNDYMWATRMTFNSSFASYCAEQGMKEPFIGVIANYGDPAGDEIEDYVKNTQYSWAAGIVGGIAGQYADGKNIPSIVNEGAFAGNDLKAQFEQADSVNGASEFERCKTLYGEYKKSPAYMQNCRAVYDSMKTIADTALAAEKAAEGKEGREKDAAFLAFYKNYLDEMSGLYNKAQLTSGENGIMIVINVENGNVKCSANPSSAVPNKN